MKFQEQALQYCNNISLLSGVYCTLMDVRSQTFFKASFQERCNVKNTVCHAGELHSRQYGKAVENNGYYMYRCPCGFMFVLSFLRQSKEDAEYGMLAGPFLLSDETEAQWNDIPLLSAEKAEALGQSIYATCNFLAQQNILPEADRGVQEETLQTLAVYQQTNTLRKIYPMDDERLLQQMIREGRRFEAQQLLNALLIEIYSGKNPELSALKLRIRDLITLMSRASADSGADVEAVLALCDRSMSEIDCMTDFDSMDAWLGKMLHRFFDLAFDFSDVKHQHVIRRLSAYLQEHLSKKLTLNDAAEYVYLSKSYLCRVLREEIGCTFTEYLNQMRVERSKAYLLDSNLSISEIACLVGYDDQSYFTRVFRRIEGMPPGKYRLKQKQ